MSTDVWPVFLIIGSVFLIFGKRGSFLLGLIFSILIANMYSLLSVFMDADSTQQSGPEVTIVSLIALISMILIAVNETYSEGINVEGNPRYKTYHKWIGLLKVKNIKFTYEFWQGFLPIHIIFAVILWASWGFSRLHNKRIR